MLVVVTSIESGGLVVLVGNGREENGKKLELEVNIKAKT